MTTDEPHAGGGHSEDERLHLQLIQGVIARLASTSATVKGLSLTVAVAAFGFSATRAEPFVAMIGLAAVTAFGFLDAYYLREERLFRKVYDAARCGQLEVYSMDKNQFRSGKNSFLDLARKGGELRSWAVAGYYTPWLLVGIAAWIWAVCQ